MRRKMYNQSRGSLRVATLALLVLLWAPAVVALRRDASAQQQHEEQMRVHRRRSLKANDYALLMQQQEQRMKGTKVSTDDNSKQRKGGPQQQEEAVTTTTRAKEGTKHNKNPEPKGRKGEKKQGAAKKKDDTEEEPSEEEEPTSIDDLSSLEEPTIPEEESSEEPIIPEEESLEEELTIPEEESLEEPTIPEEEGELLSTLELPELPEPGSPTTSPTQFDDAQLLFTEETDDESNGNELSNHDGSNITFTPRISSGAASRQGIFGSVVPDEAVMMMGPFEIERELFPKAVELKAHSSVSLEEFDPAIFSTTQALLTQFFQQVLGEGTLRAYRLQVDYAEQGQHAITSSTKEEEEEEEEQTSNSVVITEVTVSVVLDVMNDVASGYDLTHADADVMLFDFFHGRNLMHLIGQWRLNGVEVNELLDKEDDFESPVFAKEKPTIPIVVEETKQKKNPAATWSLIVVGLIVIASLMFAYKDELKGPVGRLKTTCRYATLSLRRRLTKVQDKVEHTLKKTFSNQDSTSHHDGSSSWSGSQGAGMIQAAAIQKGPAYSSDYLPQQPIDSPSAGECPSSAIGLEDISLSGDYDVPEEYSVANKSPLSACYNVLRGVGHSILPIKKEGGQAETSSSGEEFSMPEEYSTVPDSSTSGVSLLHTTYASTYHARTGGHDSNTSTTQPKPNTISAVNPFDYSPRGGTTPTSSRFYMTSPSTLSSQQGGGSSLFQQASSMLGDAMTDVWSVPSFETPATQAGQQQQPASGDSNTYRHWDDRSPRGSPGSDLALPCLR